VATAVNFATFQAAVIEIASGLDVSASSLACPAPRL
jgi:hypothetical protein